LCWGGARTAGWTRHDCGGRSGRCWRCRVGWADRVWAVGEKNLQDLVSPCAVRALSH
jgi:hypothetical protein